jgi:hypothetical protein
MYVVRDIFTARPGMASKLAKIMKEVGTMQRGPKTRVLTDMVAGYNTVIMETEFKDLAAFEKNMEEYASMPADVRQKMAGYTDLWTTGKREILRVLE